MNISNTSFLDACNLREPEHTPVWFMRQAGRYLPSYIKIKGTRSVIDISKDPEASSEVVVDAVRFLGVDAGIIFADIMLPLEAMGVEFYIQENLGPIIKNPLRTRSDIDALRTPDIKTDLDFIFEGIDNAIRKLDGLVPLIGFSGAPFTLAAYMIEGGPSRDLERTRVFMHSDPDLWNALMNKLSSMVKLYLQEQIKHNVSAVQLFDSWVGCLSQYDYRKYVFPFTKSIFSHLSGVPKIHFCANSANLIKLFYETGSDVISVDWRLPLNQVWDTCGNNIAVQGNLDPTIAVAGGKVLEMETIRLLEEVSDHRGHIFSLGHGVLKETNPQNLIRVVNMVHNKTRRKK